MEELIISKEKYAELEKWLNDQPFKFAQPLFGFLLGCRQEQLAAQELAQAKENDTKKTEDKTLKSVK